MFCAKLQYQIQREIASMHLAELLFKGAQTIQSGGTKFVLGDGEFRLSQKYNQS